MSVGQDAVDTCLAAYREDSKPERSAEAAATKYLLGLLGKKAPGRSVEVRIPPYAAAQIIEGVRHTRGNPPATVECDARTFIQLTTGGLTWSEATASGLVRASGERSDLSSLLPLT